MLWLGRKKEKIGNVNISFEVHTKFKQFIPHFKHIVLLMVEENDRLQHFGLITFILEDQGKFGRGNGLERIRDLLIQSSALNESGYVKSNEVNLISLDSNFASAKIHLNVDTILLVIISEYIPWILDDFKKYGDSMLKKAEIEIGNLTISHVYEKLRGTLEHELTHAIHFLREGLHKRIQKIGEKSYLITLRMLKNTDSLEHHIRYSRWLAGLRKTVELLVFKIYIEGLAMYYEKLLDDKTFFSMRDENFLKLYSEAYDESKGFFTRLMEDTLPNLNVQKFQELERKKNNIHGFVSDFQLRANLVSYKLGLHMTFTIDYTLYLGEDLFDLSFAQFIRLYEKACAIRNVQPIISLSSNKGRLFDYKEALRMLHRAEKA